MILVEAFQLALKNALIPQGRASRAEYWWFVLANLVVGIVIAILTRVSGIFVIVNILYTLAIIVPGLMIAIRRMHDTNKSGWFLLIGIIPIVGSIVLIVMLAQKGTPGMNNYGTPSLALNR